MFKAKSPIEHIYALSTCLTLTDTLTHIGKHTHTHYDSLTLSLSHTYTHTHTHTYIHAHRDMCKKSEYVYLRKFGAVWKGRYGGQELSAEVIRAPG